MNTPDKEYSENESDPDKDAAAYGNASHVMKGDNFNDGAGGNPNFSYQPKIARAADEKHPKNKDSQQMQNKDKS